MLLVVVVLTAAFFLGWAWLSYRATVTMLVGSKAAINEEQKASMKYFYGKPSEAKRALLAELDALDQLHQTAPQAISEEEYGLRTMAMFARLSYLCDRAGEVSDAVRYLSAAQARCRDAHLSDCSPEGIKQATERFDKTRLLSPDRRG